MAIKSFALPVSAKCKIAWRVCLCSTAVTPSVLYILKLFETPPHGCTYTINRETLAFLQTGKAMALKNMSKKMILPLDVDATVKLPAEVRQH
jgi:hypothetical protein